MKSKTHTSQKDPPAGSAAVVERELKPIDRSGGKRRNSSQARKRNKKAMDQAAPHNGTRGGP
jgi:hypothetical protein